MLRVVLALFSRLSYRTVIIDTSAVQKFRSAWDCSTSSQSQWTVDGYKTTTRRLGTIKDEMTLRLTEAELARDVHAVLARVRDEGLEVIVEQDHRALAIPEFSQAHGAPGRLQKDLATNACSGGRPSLQAL